MYPITSAVKALFDSEQRQVLRITGASPRKTKTISIYSGNSKVFESDAGQSISVYSGDTEIYNNTGADEIDVYSGDKIVYYYDKDGKYWAFYENGAYASAGVDSTNITEGAVYAFKAE